MYIGQVITCKFRKSAQKVIGIMFSVPCLCCLGYFDNAAGRKVTSYTECDLLRFMPTELSKWKRQHKHRTESHVHQLYPVVAVGGDEASEEYMGHSINVQHEK